MNKEVKRCTSIMNFKENILCNNTLQVLPFVTQEEKQGYVYLCIVCDRTKLLPYEAKERLKEQ